MPEPEDDGSDPFTLPRGTLRYPNGQPIRGPTVEYYQSVFSRENRNYRLDNRHLNTHYEGSMFWYRLPYNINGHVWLQYYALIKTFIGLFVGEIMYVHARVNVPVPVTSDVREVIYLLFLYSWFSPT